MNKSCKSLFFPFAQVLWTLIQTWLIDGLSHIVWFRLDITRPSFATVSLWRMHCSGMSRSSTRSSTTPLSPRSISIPVATLRTWVTPSLWRRAWSAATSWLEEDNMLIETWRREGHLPRRSQGRTRDTLRSGWLSTTKPDTLGISSLLVTSPCSSISTLPSGLQQSYQYLIIICNTLALIFKTTFFVLQYCFEFCSGNGKDLLFRSILAPDLSCWYRGHPLYHFQ